MDEHPVESHSATTEPEGSATQIGPKVNLAESPLSWLHARGKLSAAQFSAGEMLRRDYEIAALGQRVTMDWDAPSLDRHCRRSTRSLDFSERQLAAKARFDGAMKQAGPGLADVLWRCVCDGVSLPIAERLMKWPSRSGHVILKLALDRVAAHYRVT